MKKPIIPFVFLLCLNAAAELATLFQNPPEDASRPCVTFSLEGGREDDLARAFRLLERAKEIGAGGVLVSLPRATPDVWTNMAALARKAGRLNMDVSFRDFALTNSPAIGTNALSRGQFSRHVNQLLYESQTELTDSYGGIVLGYHFDHVPKGMCDIVNDLVQEAGLQASAGVFSLPLIPEEAAAYFHRPALQETMRHAAFGTTNAQAVADAERRSLLRENFNRRAGGGARAMWRPQIWGYLNITETNSLQVAEILPFAWKPQADCLFAAGATRIVLHSDRGLPSDDKLFREMRESCAYLHRCAFLLQQGHPVADFLFWPGPLTDPWPEGCSCDVADRSMLDRAAIRDGQIRFSSERSYSRLLMTTNVAQDKASQRVLGKCAQAGVSVFTWPAHPAQDLVWSVADSPEVFPLRFLHRRTDQEEIYFLVNPKPSPAVLKVTFRDTGRGVPCRWNPLAGEISFPESFTQLAGGSVQVPLFLDAHDSCFIVFAR